MESLAAANYVIKKIVEENNHSSVSVILKYKNNLKIIKSFNR